MMRACHEMARDLPVSGRIDDHVFDRLAFAGRCPRRVWSGGDSGAPPLVGPLKVRPLAL